MNLDTWTPWTLSPFHPHTRTHIQGKQGEVSEVSEVSGKWVRWE